MKTEPAKTGFPAEEKIGEIRRLLAGNREVVVVAPPGSGKTTCIPPALLGESWLGGRKIVMLEPRRLAARSCAAFIASRLGERTGGTVGYRVRLENRTSRATRLEIVTEGLLAQRILSDPELQDTGLLVFDEFHERSLACDLAFAMALEVRRALRPDLRIAVMSATLDAEETAKALDNPAIVRAEGRMFPVETVYLGETGVGAAVHRALRETRGDILCFLPGEGEIRRAAETLAPLAGEIDILPLYGSLPKPEQDRIFEPSPRRKTILATSIAETSLTIPGVACVIDSGLMRISRYSPSTGMDGLVTEPLPLDRAEQRRGRAGRTAPGVCYRLWDAAKEAFRPQKASPEILRADLASTVLSCAAWGAFEPGSLPWPTKPPAAAWESAAALLRALGATDKDGRPTEKGAAMAALPMHPRLANMVVGSGFSRKAALLAAIIEETRPSRETDIRKILDEIEETPGRPSSKRIVALSERFSSAGAGPRRGAHTGASGGDGEKSEGALLALAFPDRIARNRGNGSFVTVGGKGAAIDRLDPLSKSPFLVCCILDAGATGDAKIRLACPVDEQEIESMFADSLEDERVCAWDPRQERVVSSVRTMLGKMPLRTASAPPADADALAEALAAGIRDKGFENLPCWTPRSRQTLERLDFLARFCNWPVPDRSRLAALVAENSGGATKWQDLKKIDMERVFDMFLALEGRNRRQMDALAPARLALPSGNSAAIDYSGEEPVLSARLQECFGMAKTPMVAGGAVPVVITLLSPARRPIQTTKDIEGFWNSSYALVRKDMRGRYPKHNWPENPWIAGPKA